MSVRDAVIVAEVTRSGLVESVHHGSAIALAGDGSSVVAIGDVTGAVFGRSSNKPMQAVAMVRRGLRLPGELLALVCASHSGEDAHIDGVRTILALHGLDEARLANTPDWPLDEASARRAHRPSAILQNCSGKHAAMLATCVINGWETDGYLEVDHPLQQAITETIVDLAGEEPSAIGVDGCGAPAHALSLTALARAFAVIAGGASGSAEALVAGAMRAHPWMVGGTDRDVTQLMEAIPGLMAKDGAEAVFAAAFNDGRSVALKIADGGDRARSPLMVALLERLGFDVAAVPAAVAHPSVLGHGRVVGEVRIRI